MQTPLALDAFRSQSLEQDRGGGPFELESERMLDINLAGEVWIKTGTMVAYTGSIGFVRERILEQGVGTMLKKMVSGAGTSLTKATGTGSLFCADEGKKITLLELRGEAVYVNGNDLLAFQPTLDYRIKMMRKVGAALTSGLFNIRLEGHGLLAVTTHYDPLTFEVTPDAPLVTDPNATVMWSDSLTPQIKTDIQLKTFFGRGSGESIQMRFEGDGFVTIQPFEERPVVTTTGG